MDAENDLKRLTEENETFRKIIEIQQHTIRNMVDYYILEKGMFPVTGRSKNI